MQDPETTKQTVRERYAGIAAGTPLPVAAACCGTSGLTSFAEAGYEGMEGYAKDADLSLGCGIPTAFASLAPGEVVVDLGSGAGNDAFIAARAVGAGGRVIGIDMTPEMIAKARANAEKLGTANVEFRLGEIEALPVESGTIDAVISNCVLNLVPDKEKAFAEIHRILKPSGRFIVSDVVLEGDLPADVRRNAELWAGCVSGALQKDEYLSIARAAGFDLAVEKERVIEVPDEIVEAATSGAVPAIAVRILSITLAGRKRA
jgi:SAM-dependent methyltransferase